MEQGEPPFPSLYRRGPGTDFRICKRYILRSQQQLVISPETEIRGFRQPDIIIFSAIADLTGGKRTIQAKIVSVDLFREKHHVSVVRESQAQHLETGKVLCFCDSGPDSRRGVHGETEMADAVNDGQTRIIHPAFAKFTAHRINLNALRLNFPPVSVVAESKSQNSFSFGPWSALIAAGDHFLFSKSAFIAKNHHITSLILCDTGIESHRCRIRYHGCRKDRIAGKASYPAGGIHSFFSKFIYFYCVYLL